MAALSKAWREAMRREQGHRRRGVVAVLVAISMVVLLGCAALAIDVGMLYNTKGDLQRLADASALAAAQAMASYAGDDEAEMEELASAAAREIAAANAVIGISGSPSLEDNDIELFSRNGYGAPDAVRVIAKRVAGHSNGPCDLLFAAIFGLHTSNVSASAAAAAPPLRSLDGVPIGLRTPAFGPIDPDIVEANPGKDGPSEPTDGEAFEIGEKVTVFAFGKGKKSPVHLILNTNDIRGEAQLGKVMAGDEPGVPLAVGDTVDVVGDGTGHNGLGVKLARRLGDGNPDNNTIVVPIVRPIDNYGDCDGPCDMTFDADGALDGDVKIVDFIAIHLDAIEEVAVPDPAKPGRMIDIELLVGTVVRTSTDGESADEQSGFVDGSVLGNPQLIE